MIWYRSLLLLGFGLAWADLAQAQHRAVVVPAEAGVVIPARGAAPPPTVPQTRRARRSIGLPREAPRQEVSPLLVALPLTAAAALLAAALSSSGGSGGGGVSAPVRTR